VEVQGVEGGGVRGKGGGRQAIVKDREWVEAWEEGGRSREKAGVGVEGTA